MKIAFVGKGGSGKSTITSLYGMYLSLRKPVLCIDADINMHLGEAMGFSSEEFRSLPQLGLHGKDVKEYLRGTNPRITQERKIIKTTPPGRGSQLIQPSNPHDPLLEKYSIHRENLSLMAAGTLHPEDRGAYCYHKYSGVVEVVLNHMVDTKEDRVIVDMTAGTDAFSTGLFAAFDITFMIVEPTKKSIDVFLKYEALAQEFQIPLFAIGNKIRGVRDTHILSEALGDSLCAMISADDHIVDYEQGEESHLNPGKLTLENQRSLELIESIVSQTTKDWESMYSNLCSLHTNNALVWANAMHNTDFTQQIDPEFSYTDLSTHS